MSSILDALRKLEEEKAQRPAAPQTPRPIEPMTREPAPRRSRSRRPARSRRTRQDPSRKLLIAVPVVIFGLGIIWAATTRTSQSDSPAGELVVAANTAQAVIAESVRSDISAQGETTLDSIEADLRIAAETPAPETVTSIRQASLAAPIQSAAPEPEPVQPEAAAPIVTPAPPREPVVETPAPVDSEPNIATASIAPIQVDMTPVPMAVEPEPEALPEEEPRVEPVPEPVEMAPVEPEAIEPEPEVYEEFVEPPRAESSERYRKAMAVSEALQGGTPLEKEPEVAVDIRRYDIMTRTVRARFNIPELNINMLMQPNERHPRPKAVINYNSVYVGEAIPDTKGRVHLIGVDIRGIAVEVDGKRFYYPK